MLQVILLQIAGTVKGLVQKTIFDKLCAEVHFKAGQNSPLQTFVPGTINSFSIDEDIFRTVVFQNTSLDPVTTDTSFAKQLVLGKYELYSFTRRERPFFIVRDQSTSSLLFNTAYNGHGDVDQEGNYTSRLGLLKSQCATDFWTSQTIDYTEKDIASYISKLNNCIARREPIRVFITNKNQERTSMYLEEFCRLALKSR